MFFWPTRASFCHHSSSPHFSVRPEGAYHQWRKVPPRELSIDLVADERPGRATGLVEAS